MPKIVHFGKYYYPDVGGIESVTTSVAQGAVRFGHNVKVLCFKTSSINDVEMINGVQVMRTPISLLLASQPLSWSYLMLCRREARTADIVHLHAPNMLAALASLLIGKRVRLLVHWHSDVVGKGLLRWIVRPLERAMLKRADRVIVATPVYAAASAALSQFMSKVTVLPYGSRDPKEMESSKGSTRQLPSELAASLSGKRLILAVGRLVPYKGFGALIEAAKHLQEGVSIVIVGGGPLREALQNAIDRDGLGDRVRLAGHLSDGVLHMLLATATLFCLPSIERSEAFGVVLLEAMAYGLPIVTTDIPGSGVPWVNQHGISGVNVPVGNPLALAKALNDLLSSEEKRILLSQGARQRFENEFTEEVAIQRIMHTYSQLLTTILI